MLKAFVISALLFLVVTILGMFLSNPHGGPGGYYYAIGVVLIYPLALFSSYFAPFTEWWHWAAGYGLQYLCVLFIVLLYQYLSHARRRDLKRL